MSERESRCPVLRLGPFCEGTQILFSLRGGCAQTLKRCGDGLRRRKRINRSASPSSSV